MKIRFLLLLTALAISVTLFAQPAIDSTHMPVPGDSVTRTVVTNLNAIDYTLADSNYVWDFSMLNGNTTTGDTFVTVLSTEVTYNVSFNNPFDKEHKATVAAAQTSTTSLPGLEIANMVSFYKRAYTYYGQVGFGAEINGIPLPVKFDHADTICKFPMIFGSTYASLSQYGIDVPSLGYNAQRKNRVNYVDGWGTLYLPGDTFEVVRLRSEIAIFDSLFIDSIGYGFGFNHSETEYKWISTESKLPVFQVNKRQGGGNFAQAWFLDHRDPYAGMQEAGMNISLKIYPNPANQVLYLGLTAGGNEQFEILDTKGSLVSAGSYDVENGIDIGHLNNGPYLIRIISRTSINVGTFLKQ